MRRQAVGFLAQGHVLGHSIDEGSPMSRVGDARCQEIDAAQRVAHRSSGVIGRPASGSRTLGMESVSGESRVAYPAASTIAFSGAPGEAPLRPLGPRGQVVGLPSGEDVVLDDGAWCQNAGDFARELLGFRRVLPLLGDSDGVTLSEEGGQMLL